jgi:hypothetical protein
VHAKSASRRRPRRGARAGYGPRVDMADVGSGAAPLQLRQGQSLRGGPAPRDRPGRPGRSSRARPGRRYRLVRRHCSDERQDHYHRDSGRLLGDAPAPGHSGRGQGRRRKGGYAGRLHRSQRHRRVCTAVPRSRDTRDHGSARLCRSPGSPAVAGTGAAPHGWRRSRTGPCATACSIARCPSARCRTGCGQWRTQRQPAHPSRALAGDRSVSARSVSARGAIRAPGTSGLIA